MLTKASHLSLGTTAWWEELEKTYMSDLLFTCEQKDACQFKAGFPSGMSPAGYYCSPSLQHAIQREGLESSRPPAGRINNCML